MIRFFMHSESAINFKVEAKDYFRYCSLFELVCGMETHTSRVDWNNWWGKDAVIVALASKQWSKWTENKAENRNP